MLRVMKHLISLISNNPRRMGGAWEGVVESGGGAMIVMCYDIEWGGFGC